MEQEIDAGRTELVNSGREQLLDAMLRAWTKRVISVSSFLVLGKRQRGGLRVELRGSVLISGFWQPALRNVKKMKYKKLLLLEIGDEEVTRPQPDGQGGPSVGGLFRKKTLFPVWGV